MQPTLTEQLQMISDPNFSKTMPLKKVGSAAQVAENWFVEFKRPDPEAKPKIRHAKGGGLELRWQAPVARVRVWQELDLNSAGPVADLDLSVSVQLAGATGNVVEWIAILEDNDGDPRFHAKFKPDVAKSGDAATIGARARNVTLEPEKKYRFCIQFATAPNTIILRSVSMQQAPASARNAAKSRASEGKGDGPRHPSQDPVIDLVHSSPAFDAKWYSNEYLDVKLSGLDPAYHYSKFGVAMRRSPSAGLCPNEYEREFPSAIGQNPVVHYEHYGSLIGFDLERGILPDAAFIGPGAVYSLGKGLPLVSVIVTAFNAEETIETCLASLLKQTLSNIEIIVVDDLSTDRTPAIVEKVARADNRVRLVRLAANRGTYWAKNLGLYLARAPVVALSDSDDTSSPDRLEQQYAALTADRKRLVCYVNYRRVGESGAMVLNRGQEHRLGFMTMMARKELFDVVGFFDSVRIAADDEFHSRVKLLLDKSRYCHLPLPLYHALVRSDSLTAVDAVKLDTPAPGASAPELSFLSPTRRSYVKAYKDWHQEADKLQLEFPLRSRPFPAPAIAVAAFHGDEKITASMATFPPRAGNLKRVVSRLLPQVDVLRIHLNNFETVPEFLQHDKISISRSQDYGDLRDNGKFINIEEVPAGFHFCVDDDIVYPRNYVRYLVAKIMQYDRRAVVGFHGTVILPNFVRYHDGVSRKTWHFQNELPHDEPVHILGTGTVAYHTSALRFDLGQVSSTGMIDLWLARAAQRQDVPMVAVTRGRKYLSEMAEQRISSLYEERRLNDSQETDFIRSIDWQIRSPFVQAA